MEEIKFCKDCKFSIRYSDYWCTHPGNELDVVTGETINVRCSHIRLGTTLFKVKCNRQATMFQPKEVRQSEISLVGKIINLFKKEK